jgi:hypothetical protein
MRSLSARENHVTLLDTLQRALAVEQATLYGYGLLGARLSHTELSAAQAAYAVHQTRRDAIVRMVSDLHAQPVVPPPAYRPRAPITGRTAALQLAVSLESDGVAAYIAIIGATTVASIRRSALGWLTDATVRGQAWSIAVGPRAVARIPPLPGLAEPTPPPTGTPSPNPQGS